MANPKIFIRRSATPNKVPTSDQLALGELAINTNDGKLYLEKDPNGVGIGTTVVCVNPFNVGVGSLSYDINFTAGDVGIGTDDVSTAVGSNNTAVLAAGIVTAYKFYGDGSALTGISGGGSSVTVSESAPGSPSNGDLWWDSDVGELYIYYTDGDSNQWVETSGGSALDIVGKFVSNDTGIHTTRNVGIGTTTAGGAVHASNTAVLNVGVVTANYIYGDGSNLTGISAGVWQSSGTGISTTKPVTISNGLNVTGVLTAAQFTATDGFNLGISSAGTSITGGPVKTLNFIGTGNTILYNASTDVVDISIAGGGVAVSTTAPSGPEEGDLWWNSDSGNLAIYYEDGDSNQWVSAGAVGAQGPQGATGAASTTGYPGTVGQLLQHNGTSFVGIASTGYRDYVINQGQGYYAYTTDFYTVGTANTTQSLEEGVWTLLQPQVANTGLYNHQPTCMNEANSGNPWVGTGATVGTGQTEFSLAGTKAGTMCLVRTLIRFEPDTDETDLDLRLKFTTNTATQGTGLTNFYTQKQALVMTVGAGITYSSEEIISFFVGSTLEGQTKSDAGKFCIEANSTTDGTLEIQGVTVMVDI